MSNQSILPRTHWHGDPADRLREENEKLREALRKFRVMLDESEDIPTTCAQIANEIDDLMGRQ